MFNKCGFSNKTGNKDAIIVAITPVIPILIFAFCSTCFMRSSSILNESFASDSRKSKSDEEQTLSSNTFPLHEGL